MRRLVWFSNLQGGRMISLCLATLLRRRVEFEERVDEGGKQIRSIINEMQARSKRDPSTPRSGRCDVTGLGR